MLLIRIVVIGPEFKFMSRASIRMNLKCNLYLFKLTFDAVSLDNCFRIIIFSVNCNALRTFIDKKSLASALIKISNPF